IIENADCFGLAQLHQIRGRIGRSSRRAYAYLTFRRGKILNEDATKRLEAIREFAEFGSGLKIAMRDLEIRGAGNILGGEQHGQMASVGYDMYLKLLEQAVREEKGEKVEEIPECMVDMQIEAHIPEWYISNLSQRIGVYRTIADIKTEDDVYDVTDELIDRFGQPPSSVMGLIKVALLRNRAANLGIYEAVQRGDSMLLYINSPDIQKVMSLSNKMRGRIRLNAGNKPHIVVKLLKSQEPLLAFNEVLTHLEKDE
ncbi:MAG: transcription-repair coupling factor, partial [Clostridia bacterium]|nr:transcription-repair coupling factor [Clostridia bacterium]